MTLKRFIKTEGITMNVPRIKRWSAVEIGFIGSNGYEDYTEFHVQHALTNDGINELDKLYSDFCKDEKIPKDTVEYVSIRVTADTEDSLWELAA
nr:hypothetical protein [uncultured Butyrivibrio sp.]